MFLAIPHLDFYYLVEDESKFYESFIALNEEEYLKLFKEHEKTGYMIRGKLNEKGNISLILVKEIATLPYQYWDIETGSWKEDLELKEKILTEEYIQKVNSGIEWATYEIENIQELVDFDEADEQDEAHLLEAKKYRVALNKIKRSLDYPNLEVELPERPY